MVSSHFESAWKYVPFLLLTVLYSSFSGFLGQYYIAAKETLGVFTTTVIGAILNIIFNFIFIPTLGLMGAGISSALSFGILWLIRIKNTQKFVKTDLKVINILANHIIIGLQIFILFSTNGIIMYSVNFILLCISLLLNKDIVLAMLKMVFRMKSKN
ncbi:polysaccharide biosynthesis protein [Loigolactobacillus zhaoyuanensis]|uniref:Polysaccharide biosynthesis C-terminal domain-containing protein n=1 Tax=Loigolactobacillus zhaoyuanensis TaxID=2486017 RepID=A0ABW8UDJ2_9LACO